MPNDLIDEGINVDDILEEEVNLDINDFPEDDGGLGEPVKVQFDDEPNEPIVDEEKVKLRNELEQAAIERNNLLNQAQQNEALAQALSKINDSLKKDDDDSEEAEAAPQLDLQKIIENVDKNLVVKPGETLMQALVPIVQQLEKASEIKLSKLEKEQGKARIFQDDELRAVYNKYGSEIEKKAKKLKGMNAYVQAVKEVRAEHIEDFIAAGIEREKENIKAELLKELGGSDDTGKKVTFTNATKVANKPQPLKLKNRKELELVKEWAFKTGGFFDIESDPQLMETAIATCRKQGIIS